MIHIKIPCSTSNLGPGFDTLGLALNRYLLLSAEESNGLIISVEGNGKDHIATDTTNLVYSAMAATAQKVKNITRSTSTYNNGVPVYGGLGGSGAAIAGGVFLADQLLNIGLSRDKMLNIAVEIEGHPDNVSAAIFGGLTINCFDAERKVHCTSVKIDLKLSVVACSPHFQVQTKEARKILPQQVSLKDAVTSIENAASLVAAMMNGNYDALRYVTAERLHEHNNSANAHSRLYRCKGIRSEVRRIVVQYQWCGTDCLCIHRIESTADRRCNGEFVCEERTKSDRRDHVR